MSTSITPTDAVGSLVFEGMAVPTASVANATVSFSIFFFGVRLCGTTGCTCSSLVCAPHTWSPGNEYERIGAARSGAKRARGSGCGAWFSLRGSSGGVPARHSAWRTNVISIADFDRNGLALKNSRIAGCIWVGGHGVVHYATIMNETATA